MAKEAAASPPAIMQIPENIGGREPYRRARTVASGAHNIAAAKLEPPMKA